MSYTPDSSTSLWLAELVHSALPAVLDDHSDYEPRLSAVGDVSYRSSKVTENYRVDLTVTVNDNDGLSPIVGDVCYEFTSWFTAQKKRQLLSSTFSAPAGCDAETLRTQISAAILGALGSSVIPHQEG